MEQDLSSNVQVEITVLGSMLLEESAINDALEHLVAEDFCLDSHRKIFRAICELSETGNTVDYITVMDDLQRRKELDAIGGPAYLAHLTEGIPRRPNIETYCRIIKDKAILRSVAVLGDTMTARAADQSETSREILEDVEEQILELSQRHTTQSFTTILDAVEEVGNVDAYMEKMCDPAEMTGLATGFIEVDKVWGGMQPKNLIIVAARPSMGKTAWLINTAVNIVVEDGEKVVALFSLEMSKDAFYKRMLASVAEVSSRRAQEGFISGEEKRRLTAALMQMAALHIFIDDTAEITPMQMRARARRLKQKMGRLDVVGVDYVQLIKGNGKHENRQVEVGSVSRSLKALAKELGVPVVALAQLNRGNEQRGDKRPMLSDLRESGSLEQDADVVAFIHRPEYYAGEDDPDVERGIAEFITAKNRDGATGTRKLAYQAAITKFSNLQVERGVPPSDYRQTDY